MQARIGKRVKLMREQRAWTQEALAEKAGLDRRTIQRVEADEGQSFKTIAGLSEAFGVGASQLRFGATGPDRFRVG